MTAPHRYTVTYLWQGDRHRDHTFETRSEAAARMRELRADGWQAWVESL